MQVREACLLLSSVFGLLEQVSSTCWSKDWPKNQSCEHPESISCSCRARACLLYEAIYCKESGRTAAVADGSSILWPLLRRWMDAWAAKMCEIPIKLVHLMAALLTSVQKVPHCCTSLVTLLGCKLTVFDAYQGEVRAKTTQDMKSSCFVHLHVTL